MKTNNSRRRFVAAFSYGAMLLNLSPSVFAEAPKCKTGEILRNGWRAYWGAKKVSVISKNQLNFKRAPDLSIIETGIDIYRHEHSGTLSLAIRKVHGENEYFVNIGLVPVSFTTNTAAFRARTPNNVGKENAGIYRTPITDGASGMADVRVTFTRNGTRGLYSPVSPVTGAGFLLSAEQMEQFFSEGSDPLNVSFSADGRTLISCSYDVNGVYQVFSEAMPNHIAEKSRADKEYCSACFLTTATCKTVGLADDCWELQTLRKFRDEYMASNEEGKHQIAEYNRFAPKIIEKINNRDNARAIYLTMYWKFILPSALLIRMGLNGKAFDLYHKLVNWVQNT